MSDYPADDERDIEHDADRYWKETTMDAFNDAEGFGEAIRGHFPGLIDIASDGDVQQVNDEELVIFNGYGFRVTLSNGASFDITIQQRDYAPQDDDEWTEAEPENYGASIAVPGHDGRMAVIVSGRHIDIS